MSFQHEELLPTAQAAAHLGLKVGTFRQMAREGKVTSIRLSPRRQMFRMTDLEEWRGRWDVRVARK